MKISKPEPLEKNEQPPLSATYEDIENDKFWIHILQM